MPDVRRNPNTNNIEIIYRNKPSPKTLAALHAAGFRWSPRFKLWYGVPTKQTLALATRVDPDFRPGPFRQKRAPVQGPIASHAKPRAQPRAKPNARRPTTKKRRVSVETGKPVPRRRTR